MCIRDRTITAIIAYTLIQSIKILHTLLHAVYQSQRIVFVSINCWSYIQDYFIFHYVYTVQPMISLSKKLHSFSHSFWNLCIKITLFLVLNNTRNTVELLKSDNCRCFKVHVLVTVALNSLYVTQGKYSFKSELLLKKKI